MLLLFAVLNLGVGQSNAVRYVTYLTLETHGTCDCGHQSHLDAKV